MAFKVQYTDDGRVSPSNICRAGRLRPRLAWRWFRQAATLPLPKARTNPAYISMCERETACAAGDLIPVIRVHEDMVFETTFSAAATSVKLGDKVTLHASSGMEVTATTGGACEVVGMDGAAVGDTVRVRFVLNPPAASGS